MAKVKVKRTKKKRVVSNKKYLSANQFQQLQSTVQNTTYTITREMLNRLLSPQDNIEEACGYLATLSINDYRNMYNRYGIAKRVVHIWPDECWQSPPSVLENEDPEETEFEKAWKKLDVKFSLCSALHRADALSGIGSHGGILLGVDDGQKPDKAISGINITTGEVVDRKERNLIYLQVYDEQMLKIDTFEKDMRSPRHGHPKTYSVEISEGGLKAGDKVQQKVHWTRIVHLADNRESSDVVGVSRLQAVYNYLYDVKKVGGGSGEMFWKGGFPGYSFELMPEAAQMGAELDVESVKEQMQLYASGLQRWLSLKGVTAKSLNPQLADPTGHLDIHLRLIAISIGVPYRVLLGSEEGKLASTQDKRTWNSRVARRQTNYCTPMVVRPFIDRLINIGCLPEPKDGYKVVWPDLNVATEDDVAKVALNRTDAFSKYVAGGVDVLIPPRQYFTEVHKMSDAAVEAIEKAREKYEDPFKTEDEDKDDVSGFWCG
jgi:hypothetical protein